MRRKPKPLALYCNGVVKFPHFATMNGQDGTTRRFIGWVETSPGEWEPKTEPETVPACPEYERAVRIGDLVAADLATAETCGVPFKQPQEKNKS